MAYKTLKDTQNITGLADLSRKLEKIGIHTGGKALRNAVVASTSPTMRDMRAAAPVGSKAHKTYRDRTVAPGFLKRNIKRKSWIDKRWGAVKVIIGVSQEAFYGVQFVDRGTKFMPAQPWFVKTFEQNAQRSVAIMGAKLRKNIEKIAKS